MIPSVTNVYWIFYFLENISVLLSIIHDLRRGREDTTKIEKKRHTYIPQYFWTSYASLLTARVFLLYELDRVLSPVSIIISDFLVLF